MPGVWFTTTTTPWMRIIAKLYKSWPAEVLIEAYIDLRARDFQWRARDEVQEEAYEVNLIESDFDTVAAELDNSMTYQAVDFSRSDGVLSAMDVMKEINQNDWHRFVFLIVLMIPLAGNLATICWCW